MCTSQFVVKLLISVRGNADPSFAKHSRCRFSGASSAVLSWSLVLKHCQALLPLPESMSLLPCGRSAACVRSALRSYSVFAMSLTIGWQLLRAQVQQFPQNLISIFFNPQQIYYRTILLPYTSTKHLIPLLIQKPFFVMFSFEKKIGFQTSKSLNRFGNF